MTNAGQARILLIGYGNPGRLDDGLGPAFAARMETLALPGVVIESDYQLTLELAHDMAAYDVVIFADADCSSPKPFYFRKIAPTASSGLGSHEVSPGELVSLAIALFGATTRPYILGIRGYEFNEFGEKLSGRAANNLAAAVDFVSTVIQKGNFEEISDIYTGVEAPRIEISLDKISLN